MRIEAVNSFLSSRPIYDLPPVARVTREGQEFDLPEVKRQTPLSYVQDTIGRAVKRDQVRLVASTLSAYEHKALLRLMDEQMAKEKAHLPYHFPGLIKA